MPKYLNEILKQSAVAVVGAVVVVFVMWFTMGGGMLMYPFFVVAVVLPVLFLVCAAAVGYLLGVRYLPAVVAAFVLGWFGFDALYKHTCGPDPRDVRVMKPMAEAISSYIIKHGVPKSLEEIPGLPYKIYSKNNLHDFYTFEANKEKFEIFVNGDTLIEITAMKKKGNGYTRGWIRLNKDNNNSQNYSIEYFLVFRSGICSTLKQ